MKNILIFTSFKRVRVTSFPTIGSNVCSLLCFVSGVYVSLTSVVLVDLLGLEMLTNSFGLLLMFQGIATLIGPPIAGT